MIFFEKGYFSISDKIEFDFPTNDERIEFEASGVKEAIQGSGDSKALMLILSAELKISSALGPIQKNDTSGQQLMTYRVFKKSFRKIIANLL